nr:hypothetical protein [uncultured Acetobacterium sp.]
MTSIRTFTKISPTAKSIIPLTTETGVSNTPCVRGNAQKKLQVLLQQPVNRRHTASLSEMNFSFSFEIPKTSQDKLATNYEKKVCM